MGKQEENAFVMRKLYGGAFEIGLPQRFVDLSSFRLVPDHQEVWSDAHSDQSIIIELVEPPRVKDQTDVEAIQYHFNDIAETNNSVQTKIVSVGTFKQDSFALAKQFRCLWTFGTQKASKGRDSAEKANTIAFYLVLIRMKQFDTDLLISFNAPIEIHKDSQAKSAKDAVETPQVSLKLFQQIVSTFSIKNFSIFGDQK